MGRWDSWEKVPKNGIFTGRRFRLDSDSPTLSECRTIPHEVSEQPKFSSEGADNSVFGLFPPLTKAVQNMERRRKQKRKEVFKMCVSLHDDAAAMVIGYKSIV